ncbi:MAG: hypothetical protein ACR2F8_03075 [Caulobacteraceae bacterium]
MSVIRFLSTRSPYRRGGLIFDSTAVGTRDGRAALYLNQAEFDRISPADYADLVADPAITIEFRKDWERARGIAAAPPTHPSEPIDPAGDFVEVVGDPKDQPEVKLGLAAAGGEAQPNTKAVTAAITERGGGGVAVPAPVRKPRPKARRR